MQDVWNPGLIKKIDNFLERKSHQFPELKLGNKWNDYEVTPKRSSFGHRYNSIKS